MKLRELLPGREHNYKNTDELLVFLKKVAQEEKEFLEKVVTQAKKNPRSKMAKYLDPEKQSAVNDLWDELSSLSWRVDTSKFR